MVHFSFWYVVNQHRSTFKCEPDVGHIQIMAWVNSRFIEFFLDKLLVENIKIEH